MRWLRLMVLVLLVVGLLVPVASGLTTSANAEEATPAADPGVVPAHDALVHGKLKFGGVSPADGDALVQAFAWDAPVGADPVASSIPYGGMFELWVPAGSYRITFTDDRGRFPDFDYGGVGGAEVTVSAEEHIDLGTQSFQRPMGSGMAGVSVVSDDGTPITDAAVRVYVVEREEYDGETYFSGAYLLDTAVNELGGGDYAVDLSSLYQGLEYTVRAGAPGYDRKFLGGVTDAESASTFSIDDADLGAISLAPRAQITGVVTAPDVGPVAGVRVQLHRLQQYERSGQVWESWGRTDNTTRTRADGSYALPKPSPGQYTLQFLRDGDRGEYPQLWSEGVFLGGVRNSYYSSPARFEVADDAVPITQDMALIGVPASGIVTAADGQPLQGVALWTEIKENGQWGAFASVAQRTDENGRYDILLPRGAEVRINYSHPTHDDLAVEQLTPTGTGTIPVPSVTMTPRFAQTLGTVAGERHEYCLEETLDEAVGSEDNDDGSSGPVPLPFAVNLHGESFEEVHVNLNGNLSFGKALDAYTPRALSTSSTPVIAPYWADATVGWPGQVSYCTSSDGKHFCATWSQVPYFREKGRARISNTFQVILTSRTADAGRATGDVDIRFNYDVVSWETGDASGGTDGVGGRSAAVGYSAGTGLEGTWMELAGSRQNGALLDANTTGGLVHGSLGGAQSGRYEFEIRNATLQDGEASQEVTGGDVVTTQGEATAASPVQTSIQVPANTSGLVTVTPQEAGDAPTGFALFGTQVVISAPPATSEDPYQATFTVDASQLGGLSPEDVQVFRNGVAVADCTSATDAVPDPCVVSRGFVDETSGDVRITARTSAFSTWALGRLDYELSGPFAPMNAAPTVNVAKAGSALPVKFRLGGDRGLGVLGAGQPRVIWADCKTGQTDAVEQTVATSTSKLVFESTTATYSYLWKTERGRTGCGELVLRLRDGSKLRTLFELR